MSKGNRTQTKAKRRLTSYPAQSQQSGQCFCQSTRYQRRQHEEIGYHCPAADVLSDLTLVMIKTAYLRGLASAIGKDIGFEYLGCRVGGGT